MVCGESSLSSYRITFFISLGSAAISLLLIVIAYKMNWVPSQEPKTAIPNGSFLLQLRANLSSSTLLLWVMVSAVTRAIHTQVTTLWPLISLQISPDCGDQRFNALISFSAYLGAAIVVAIPARFSEFSSAHGRFAVAPGFLICSVLLI